MRSRNPALAVLGVLVTLVGLLMVVTAMPARADDGRTSSTATAVGVAAAAGRGEGQHPLWAG